MEDMKTELDKLTKELADLKQRLPEHCSGTKGYMGVHRASPELWEKIEALEERIEKLKVPSAKR